jgi:hypothetical protein
MATGRTQGEGSDKVRIISFVSEAFARHIDQVPIGSLCGMRLSILGFNEANRFSRKGAKGAKKILKKRGSASRLCAFAREIFFSFVQAGVL